MSALIEEAGKRSLPRIALIACGSFSPPTLMHFRMFEIARDYFEMHGMYNVVGGIVSPTHDSYGKKDLASAKHRCAMLKLALQTSSWIRVSDWETRQQQWSRTQAVLQYHQNFLNNYINSPDTNERLPGWLPSGLRERSDPIQLKLLCGADLLESFAVPGLWANEDIEAIVANHGLVVITRCGSNPEKFIFDSDVLTKYERNITLVTNWVPNEVSSSLIRRLLGRGQSVKYLIDELVLDYIKQHGLFNYSSKYITAPLQPAMAANALISPADNANNNENGEHGEDASNGNVEEEPMDESDYVIKNIFTNINLDARKAKVFCCGDGEQLGPKLLLNRNGPGQAVQVITTQKGTFERVPERVDLKSKKMKITAAQDV